MKSIGRQNHIAIYFLIMYFIILIIPLGSMVIGYTVAEKNILNNSVENAGSMLRQTSLIAESFFQKIRNNAVLINLDNFLTSILTVRSDSLNGATFYNIAKLVEQLHAYRIIDEDYMAIMVYFRESDLIITEDTCYQADVFYEKYFRWGALNSEKWFALFDGIRTSGAFFPSIPVFHNSRFTQVIPYCLPISTSSSRTTDPKGFIILLMDEKKIQSLLQNAIDANPGYACITDENGQIIAELNTHRSIKSDEFRRSIYDYHNENTVEISGETLFRIRVISAFNGWHYISFMPRNYVLRNISSLKHFFFVLFFLTVVIGFLISGYFTMLNVRPIHAIIRYFTQGGTPGKEPASCIKNEYQLIAKSIEAIQKDRQALHAKLENQLPIMRTALFEALLNDRYTDVEELPGVFEYLGIPTDRIRYLIAIMKPVLPDVRNEIHNEDLQDKTPRYLRSRSSTTGYSAEPNKTYAYNALIRELLTAGNDEFLYKHYLDRDKLVLLYGCSDDASLDFENRASTFLLKNAEIVKTYLSMEVMFGTSSTSTDMNQIGLLFKQAQDAVGTHYTGKRVVRYSQEKNSPSTFFYPMSMGIRLFTAVKSGDAPAAESIMLNLYQENIRARALSNDMRRYFINNLHCTVLNALIEAGKENIAEDLNARIREADDIESIFGTIREAISLACGDIQTDCREYTKGLVNRIIRYIQAEYHADLYLNSIAEHFRISEAYLSRVFKENTGENISRFLERTRIDRACTFFRENPGRRIKDVAHAVGYRNELTFRRAFKRYVFITPSQYIAQLETEKD